MDYLESQLTNPTASNVGTNASIVSTPVSNRDKFKLFLQDVDEQNRYRNKSLITFGKKNILAKMTQEHSAIIDKILEQRKYTKSIKPHWNNLEKLCNNNDIRTFKNSAYILQTFILWEKVLLSCLQRNSCQFHVMKCS